MAKIKVYPLAAHALRAYSGKTQTGWKLGHPIDGDLRETGSHWEHDTFTHRALRDGDVTTDESSAWRSNPMVEAQKSADLRGTAPEAAFTTPLPKKPKLDVSGV